MILAVLLSATIAGLDNLQVGAAIGLLPVGRRRLAQYAVAFAVAETAAPWAGMISSRLLFTPLFQRLDMVAPLVPIACGVAILTLLLRHRSVATLLDRPGAVVLLPLSLSYDNFLLGLGLGSIHAAMIPVVMITGMICAAMSCLGLYGAHAMRRLTPRLGGATAGLVLCATGAHAMLTSSL